MLYIEKIYTIKYLYKNIEFLYRKWGKRYYEKNTRRNAKLN